MAIDYSLNIKFNFLQGIDITNNINWKTTYLTPNNEYIENDIRFNTSSFNNSFFKLDYYDTPFSKSQKLYFTTILQASNGIQSNNLIIPEYYLDHDINTEGFYIYWLRDKTIFNLDTFYVSATFFNGKTGAVKRMSNICQGDSNLSDRYNLNGVFDFYYKLKLDYDTKTYEYFDIKKDNRIGISGAPILWYEYISRK